MWVPKGRRGDDYDEDEFETEIFGSKKNQLTVDSGEDGDMETLHKMILKRYAKQLSDHEVVSEGVNSAKNVKKYQDYRANKKQAYLDMKKRQDKDAGRNQGPIGGGKVDVKGYRKKHGMGEETFIHEAKSPMDEIRKIVDKKTAGKVSGMKVDLYSASAMVAVYNALNSQNQTKVEQMLKTKQGVLTFAEFAMSNVK
jgi:hypothetical protein